MIKTKKSLIRELERNYAEYGISTYVCADDTLKLTLDRAVILLHLPAVEIGAVVLN